MKLYKNFSPTVSIILPTFNRSELLPEAVNSVKNQTFSNWELIIVDDGSMDNTFEVVNQVKQSSENIRYLRHSNRGVALSMNAGLSCAGGEYITFLGSDDSYKTNHLKTRIDYLKNNPEVEFIHGGVEIIGNPYVQDKNDLNRKIHLDDCIIGGTIFAKREILLKLEGFNDLSYSAESDLYERAVKSGVKIERVNFPTYVYNRETPGSITNSVM